MRPKKRETRDPGDLFRARLYQIISLKHDLAQLADAIAVAQSSKFELILNGRLWHIADIDPKRRNVRF
jgi:IS5 family transposase